MWESDLGCISQNTIHLQVCSTTTAHGGDPPGTWCRCCRTWPSAGLPRMSGCSRWGRRRASAACGRGPEHNRHAQRPIISPRPTFGHAWLAHMVKLNDLCWITGGERVRGGWSYPDEVKLVGVPLVLREGVGVVQNACRRWTVTPLTDSTQSDKRI